MKPFDTGVYGTSQIYFHSQSLVGKRLYLHPICLGHYYCNQDYRVNRKNFDSFLLIHVDQGCGYVELGGRRRQLTTGSMVLIDCYAPHSYYTQTEWEISWIHFDGIMARALYEHITRNDYVIDTPNHMQVTYSLRKLLEAFKDNQKPSEAVMSKRINDLLTELIICAGKMTHHPAQEHLIEESLDYISAHMSEDISLDLLARRASLSPFYYARLFKQETGFTPHQYIIMIRLDFSRFLLKTTQHSIKEIAYKCGFKSESGFCTCFKKSIGITPNAYRMGE